MALYIASHADELGIEYVIDPLDELPLCITLIFTEEDKQDHFHYRILFDQRFEDEKKEGIVIQLGGFSYRTYLEADSTLIELIDFMGFSLDEDTVNRDMDVLNKPIQTFQSSPLLYWVTNGYDKWSAIECEAKTFSHEMNIWHEYVTSFREFGSHLEHYLSVWRKTEDDFKQDFMDWIQHIFIPTKMRQMFDSTHYYDNDFPQMLILWTKGHTHVEPETIQFLIEWLDEHMENIYY